MSDKELKEQLKKEMLDLCETNSSVMTYMECLMRKYENLQSKISKAIELIKENKDQVDWLHMPAWELENVLKEDK